MNKNELVTTNKNRAVIYARYSSATQNEETIETQIQRCNETAAKYGKTVVGIYTDEKRSGTNDRRPDFQRLLADAREHKFEYVILFLANRFSRNYKQANKHYHELKDLNVKIILTNRDFTDNDVIEDILWTIESKEAETYSQNLSQNVKGAILNNLRKGRAIGGRRLLGYNTHPKTKQIEINNAEASIVKSIFSQIAQGVPQKKVYENVSALGYRTVDNECFTVNSFQHALRNRKYIGEYTVHGVDYPDHFPPIIDKDLFERVQNILEEKAHTNGGGKAQTDYILSGKVFCGYCGGRLNGTTSYKNGTPHHYYSCSNNYNNRRTCHKLSENKMQLETAVIETVKKHLYGSMDMNKSASFVANQLKQQNNDEVKKPLEREIRSIEHNIKKALRAFADTDAPHMRKSYEQQIEADEILKSQKQAELAQIKNGYHDGGTNLQCDIIRFAREVLADDSTDTNLNKQIIHHFVNSVYVYEDRIEVVYTFSNNNTKLDPADRLPYRVYDKEINKREIA